MSRSVVLLKNASIPHDPYEARFKEEGFLASFVPLLTHTHSDREATLDYLMSKDFVEDSLAFIITSQRAVEMLEDYLLHMDSNTKSLICQKKGYTVGPATYKILKRIGFEDVRGGEQAGNGKLLAEFIDRDHLKSERIVFFTGEIRKDIIPRMLKGWGYNFHERVIYKTENRDDIVTNFERSLSAVKDTTEKWIVFYSPQGTETIVRHLHENRGSFKIACIGPTTEEYLVKEGITPHIVSSKPEANTLVQSILDCQL